MSFALFAAGLMDSLQPHLPMVIGCSVAVLVLTTLSVVMIRRTSGRIVPPPETVRKEKTIGDHLDESYADRRNSVRREGPPVPIFVSASIFRGGVHNAYVLDRSRSGLKIALDQPVTPGSTLQVKAENAPDEFPWVQVTVRSCKTVDKHYELGCEFDVTPPWNILLLFG